MAGGLTVSVRQVASYPLTTPTPNDLVLLQSAGLGGPYISASAYQLVTGAMATGGPLGVGYVPPADAQGNQIFTLEHVAPLSGGLAWNVYQDTSAIRYWTSGVGASLGFDPVLGFEFFLAPPGQAGQPIAPYQRLLQLNLAGAMSLPFGTLTVGRDPASAFEVATMGWVGASTVASFNGRRGVVTLDACDIGAALGYPTECIATLPQVTDIVCQAIQDLIRTYPAVWSFNGRVGDVWLTADDINWALTRPGAPPLVIATPPADAIDGEAVNAQWVIQYVASVLAGPPAYATQEWVTQQLASLVAVTSFNSRVGAVTLQYLDVAQLGFAPTNSPNFSGAPTGPTAAPGSSNSQLATTAFVMNTLTAISPGVISFNTRSGAVDLEATDISGVGGALLASPNFSGTPTSTTPPTGDSSQRIATTAFVMAEVAAATAGVASWNGRTGIVTMGLADITAVGGAPVVSPSFGGIPSAPTAANGTNTTQLATTAFVQNELTAISAGVITFNGRSGNVVFTANDLSAVGGAPLANPAFTGTPTATTAAPGDSSTHIATTAFVANAIQGAAVTSFNGRSGSVTLQAADLTAAGGALLASPAFTGVPTAPTPAAGNNSTALATTAFVTTALGSYLPLGGGVLTGPLTLAGNATQPLQPIPLQQLTATLANYATVAQLANYLPLTGGTLTGGLNGTTGTFSGNVSGAGFVQTGSGNALSLSNSAFINPSINQGILISSGGNANALTIQNVNPAYVFGTPGGNIMTVTSAGGTPSVGTLTMVGNGAVVAAGGGNFSPGPLQGGNIVGTIGTIGSVVFPGGGVVSGIAVNLSGAITAANANFSTPSGNPITFTGTGASIGVVGSGGVQINTAGSNNWFNVTNTDPAYVWANPGRQVMQLFAGNGNLVIAGTLSQGSDETTKNTIAPYAPGVSIASQLAPKTFIFNGDPDNVEHLGFIAQDVRTALPPAVGTMAPMEAGGASTMTLDITAILAVAINAIKQCLSRIQALETAAGITPTAAETA